MVKHVLFHWPVHYVPRKEEQLCRFMRKDMLARVLHIVLFGLNS